MTAAEDLAQAIRTEGEIGSRAAEIRGDEVVLSERLFLELWPLLTEPIPSAFIQTIGKTQGKPYASTGIKSVQVQIDRMNAVLTPLWWWDDVQYERDGKLCTVTVSIGNRPRVIAFGRSSGGVERGSTIGNIHKGSYTNAAKLAFARLGVGHEVYLGATDLDPDVSQELASDTGPSAETIPHDIAKKLVDRAWAAGVDKRAFRLYVSAAGGGRDAGAMSTKADAMSALERLTFDEAEKLDERIAKKEQEGKESE